MATEHVSFMRLLNKPYAQSLLLIALLVFPIVSFSAAGKVIFSLGVVYIERENSTEQTRLIRGDDVNAGDIINTSDNGQLQLRMADGGLIAIRPSSKFKISTFIFNHDVEKDKTFFNLLKGSFRSVTGSIGEANKKSYKVNTPIATIGIRGTDYSARLCNGDCDTNIFEDGLYIGVMSGGVVLTTEVSSMEIDASEYGYVPDLISEPMLLESAPGELLFSKTSNTQPSASKVTKNSTDKNIHQAAQEIQNENITTAVATPDIIPLHITSDNLISYVELTDELENNTTALNDETDVKKESNNDSPIIATAKDLVSAIEPGTSSVVDPDPVAIAPTPTISPPDLGRNIAVPEYFFSNNGINTSSVVNSLVKTEFETDINQNLTAIRIKTLDSSSNIIEQTAKIGTAVNADTGLHAATGISWGRWESGSMILSDGTSATSIDLAQNKLHWLMMPETDEQINLPSTGVANYTVVGNTSPTDNFGNVGTLDSARTSLTANFANQTISAAIILRIADTELNEYSITANASNIPINNLNATFSGNIDNISTTNSGALTTSSGRIDGVFGSANDSTTNNPASAGLTYSINNSIEDSDLVINDITVNGAIAYELIP